VARTVSTLRPARSQPTESHTRSRNGLQLSLARLGDAIWIYGTCRDRDAPLLPTLATKLLEAAGFAALALALADEI
jgi:hypothetical protein